MANRFEKYLAAPGTAPTVPPVIYGEPDTPDRIELERLDMSREDQALQRAAAGRAAEDQAMQRSRYDRLDQREDRMADKETRVGTGNLRKEFNALPEVKDFKDVRANYLQVKKLAEPGASAADDVAAIFSYMKLLDPGSVVREGEFATAQNTAGIPDRVVNAYNRALNGNRLSDNQRSEFRGAAANIYTQRRGTYNEKAQEFRDLAQTYDYDPDAIAREYIPNYTQPGYVPPAGQRDSYETLMREAGRTPVPASPSALVDQVVGAPEDEGLSVEITDTTDIFPRLPGETDAAYFARTEPLQAKALAERQRAIDADRDTTMGAIDATVRGAADTVTLGLSDEIAAAGNTIFSGGTMADNLANERAVARSDERVNPLARLGGQLAGGFALPIGTGRSVGQLAGIGAGYSGAYGFGSAEGDLGDRARNAAAYAPVGALAGYAGGKLAEPIGNALSRFATRSSPAQAERNALLQAAQRQDIDLIPADVGGVATKGLTAGARQGIVSEIPIAKAVERASVQGGAARDRAALAAGTPLDGGDAGEMVRRAANVEAKRTGDIGRSLYARAFNRAGDAKVALPNARAALNRNIAELDAIPGGGGALAKDLKKLRASIGEGEFGIAGVRAMQTRLREEADFLGLRGSDTNRRYKQVLDAARDDVIAGLRAAGKGDAAAAFKTADDFWKKRVETIDEVFEPLLGKNAPRSGEQIFTTLEGMAKKQTGNARMIQRVITAMPAAEASGIRASVIQRLGEATKGAQDDTGKVFSFSTFLTRWNDMSPRAKAVLFQGESRAALDDLAKVSAGAKSTAKYANTSNTARAVGVQGMVGVALASTAGIPAMLAGAGAQFLSGKVLASPAFARWLARAPRTADPAATARHVERLKAIAAREPALSPDVIKISDYLARSVSQSPGRVAAEDNRE